MKHIFIITLLFIVYTNLSIAQVNPSLANLTVSPAQSIGRTPGTFNCGDTLTASFDLRFSGIIGYLPCDSGLKVKIWGENIDFRYLDSVALNISSSPAGLDTFFSYQFSTTDTIVLTQIATIPVSILQPFVSNISIKLKVPVNSNMGDNIGIHAKLEIPSFLCLNPNQSDDTVNTSKLVFCNKALPIQITDVNASWIDRHSSKISWSVLNHDLISSFEIERKSNIQSYWNTIVAIQKSEHKKDLQQYHYIDPELFSGDLFYYRIKIIETSGNVYYSDVRKIQSEQRRIQLSGYPNPTSGHFLLNMDSNTNETIDIIVLDILGRTLLVNKTKLEEGLNIIPLDLNSLKVGTYFIRTSAKNKTDGMTVIKNE